MNTRAPVAFEEADTNLAGMLDSLSGADNYLDFLVDLMSPHLASPVLEIGAGLGDLSVRYAALGHEVVATDISERCLEHLRLELRDQLRLVAPYDVMTAGPAPGRPDEGFGSAVLSNVLEHLPDDVAALGNLAANLRPGGTIVVFVPAFEALYGRFDHMIGHHRRYRTRMLAEAFEAAGLETVVNRYVNLPGWFAWLLTVRLLGKIPTDERAVRTYDRLVVPTLRKVETKFAPPFGQSILGVARVR